MRVRLVRPVRVPHPRREGRLRGQLPRVAARLPDGARAQIEHPGESEIELEPLLGMPEAPVVAMPASPR